VNASSGCGLIESDAVPRRALLLLTAGFLAILGGTSTACGNVSRVAATPPNVVVVTIDTLRADHLPAYGYTAAATPAIDRLAREGIRFAAAYASVPMTLPSHASIFTGLLPGRHGIRDNGSSYLDDSQPTIATALRAAGYATGAFVSAFVLDSRWGLARGFDEYFDDLNVSAGDLSAMGQIQRPGQVTWSRAREWLDRRSSAPFFLWLHLFDPHTPYDPPDPFKARYVGREYDGEIAYSDSIVGELLNLLDAKQLTDRTLVVVLSDHGEGLGEHGEDEHGLLLYESTLHVPWIMRLPGARSAGSIVNQAVSLVDVLPTTLDLARVPVPAGIDGVSRVRAIASPDASGGDIVYSETAYPRQFGWSELRGVRNDQFKFIRAPRPELYDYRRDPSESVNLADREPALLARLDQILSRLIEGQRTTPTVTAAPAADAAARLNALGYFSGSSPVPGSSSHLPDPKDKTDVLRRLTRARELLDTGRESDGIALLQALVLEEPPLEAAHKVLRDYWVTRRRFAEATRWLRKALARRPRDPLLSLDLATMHRGAGQPGDALAVLDAALTRHPKDAEALMLRGEILRDTGRPADALDALRRAAESGAAPTLVNIQIARTQIAMQRLMDADATLRAVLDTDPHASGAHYLMAHIAETRGDPARAEREYQREIESSPGDFQARFNLAQLFGARGDFRAQAAMLQTIATIAPGFHEIHFHLAKALLDTGDPSRLAGAIEEATLGLKLAPGAPAAPLGHYVLADVYRIQGRIADADREVALGRALEQRASPGPAGPTLNK
jgi:choline-sulfatase